MKKISLLLLSVMLLGLSACNQVAYGQVLQSDKPRDTSPSVDQADSEALVDGNNEFAFDLYQELRHSDSNLFFSPYSISVALAMTYAGARNETEAEMANVLHFTLPQDRLHPAFNWLDLTLTNRSNEAFSWLPPSLSNQSSEAARGIYNKSFSLHIANAIWGQQGYKFLNEFLDVLGQNYGAGLRILDFINKPEPSRVTINDWVSNQTEGKINDLIPQGAIDSLTRLVLTNAIYFNASWASTFHKELTRDGIFHLLDGGNVTVPMMTQTAHFGYAEGDNYQAVELRYSVYGYSGLFSMVIFLPKAGQFNDFESSLNANLAKEIISNLESSDVILTMPKFEYESSFSLNQTLNSMGMGTAFTYGVADFSGMDGTYELFIQDVLHKAFVSVDEFGTEAAAATGAIHGAGAGPEQQYEFTIDRPFIFLIRDIPTDTTIFVGRVLNPAAE